MGQARDGPGLEDVSMHKITIIVHRGRDPEMRYSVVARARPRARLMVRSRLLLGRKLMIPSSDLLEET